MVATSTCLVALACPSFAADWSADTSLSQSVEFSDNRQLASSTLGGTITSISSLLLNVTARTPTSRFDFNGNVNYTAYAGPGAANQENVLGNSLRARYEQKFKRFDYYFSGSWTRTDASTVQLEEFGFVTLSGEINTYTINAGSRIDLTARDTLTLSSSGNFSQFAFDGGTSTSNVTSALWSHRLNPNTDWNTSVQFNWVSRDGSTSSQTSLWTVLTGFRTDLTPRLTLVLNGGAGIAPPGSGSAGSVLGDATSATGETSADWLGNARLIYSLKNTQFAIFAAKTVSPTTFGEFQQSLTAGVSVRHDINWQSSVSVNGSFARTTAASTGEYDLYTASTSYSYRITRDWDAQLSYSYKYRVSPTAQSNTVIGRLTYNYTILP
jgi:hypothetical protein